jgi:hypothetical protein
MIMTSAKLFIDDAVATDLSDQLLETALKADANVLNTYASFQLATLSVAAMILGVATEPENFERNKENLVALAEHTVETIKGLTPEYVSKMREHFASANVTATGLVH